MSKKDQNNSKTNSNIPGKNPWYYTPTFIAILFFLSAVATPFSLFLLIPGIILLVKNHKYTVSISNIASAYGGLLGIQKELDKAKAELVQINEEKQKELDKAKAELVQIDKEKSKCEKNFIAKKAELEKDLKIFEGDVECASYDASEYDALSSEECKNKLSLLKAEEKNLTKNKQHVTLSVTGRTKKADKDNITQITRCFNAECDNVLLNLTVKTIDTSRKKITSAFESLNRVFAVDGIELSKQFLNIKLEELNLVYSAALKKQQEDEIQKEIKEQMKEEQKALREYENEKKKIEKDQTQVNNEINRLMQYLSKSNSDIEKQLYADKIRELEDKIKELEERHKDVTHRQETATAGYVYVISNIGSFGDDVYKIGMTRRLEPMDRIKELSNASVPFSFDVHAMIFSENAPKLETALHERFRNRSINQVNFRKEFFRVTLDEIEDVVKNEFDGIAEFTRIPAATEYRQTVEIEQNEKGA